MDWNLVVLGMSLIMFCFGLFLGYFIPKDLFGENLSIVFIYFLGLVSSLLGLGFLAYGLRR